MSTFNYTAVDNLGRKKKGVLSAQSEREARKFIKDLNLTPISVKQLQGIKGIKSKVKNKDIVIMTRQIATLLEADTSIIDALKITADQISNKDLVLPLNTEGTERPHQCPPYDYFTQFMLTCAITTPRHSHSYRHTS